MGRFTELLEYTHKQYGHVDIGDAATADEAHERITKSLKNNIRSLDKELKHRGRNIRNWDDVSFANDIHNRMKAAVDDASTHNNVQSNRYADTHDIKTLGDLYKAEKPAVKRD